MDYILGFILGYFWKKIIDFLWSLSEGNRDTYWIDYKHD